MRYWTVEEARAYLPRLKELVERIVEAAKAAARTRSNGHGGPPPDVEEALAELSVNDIVLRDPRRGLIDFHAQGRDGVVYFLCWRIGEDDLGWWHLPEEGFAGRKRLPREDG